MKKNIKVIAVLALMVMTLSCNLDLAPENTMVDEITYKDAKTSEAALLGAYNRMNAAFSGAPTGVNNYANTGLMLLYAELGTPTLEQRSNSLYISMDNSDYNSSDHDGYILSIWQNLYNAIDYANNIIFNVQKFGEYEEKIMEQHIAEAKFLRAYQYLLLLQSYGDGALTGKMDGAGVILRLTPYDGYNPDLIESRVSVATIYQQIINDLEEAIPHLPDHVATTLVARTRATQSAAKALLSRVYLYKGSYNESREDLEKALQYADEVLDADRGYTVSVAYSNLYFWMFPLNETGEESNSANYSDEVIFLAPCYTNESLYSNGVGYAFYNKSAFYIDQQFIDLYEVGDGRGYVDPAEGRQGLIWQGSPTTNPSNMTSYKYNNGNGYNNVIYIRASELLLTKAEVLARLEGVNETSVELLNQINQRPFVTKPTPYSVSDFSTAEQLVDRVLFERQLELAYEGHTRFDLIRSGKKLKDNSIPTSRMMLPIPDYEIRISYGKIVQNEGYR